MGGILNFATPLTDLYSSQIWDLAKSSCCIGQPTYVTNLRGEKKRFWRKRRWMQGGLGARWGCMAMADRMYRIFPSISLAGWRPPPTPPLNLLWSAATCAAGLQRSTKEVTYKAAGRVAVGRLKAPFTCRTEIELFSFEFLAGPLDVKMGGCFCALPLEKEKNTNKRNICEEERMTES